jgi:hypothetical protein
LVNSDRVKRKLPSLLVEGSTAKKKSWNSFMRYRYRFTQFKKQQPEKFNSITIRILSDLTDLETAVNESNKNGRDINLHERFTKGFSQPPLSQTTRVLMKIVVTGGEVFEPSRVGLPLQAFF